MKRKWNPITRKDLMITSRSMKFSWGIFAYEAILMLVFLIALSMISTTSRYRSGGNAEMFSQFVAMFPSVSIAELVMVALVIPVLTASSISGEKERQTFDILLTTEISPFQIVFGKMGTAIVQIMMYVIVSIPIMAMGFTIGGIGWWALGFYLVLALVLAIFEGAIGVFCSSVCKRSISAIIMSYVILAFFYGVTFVPLIGAALMDYTVSTTWVVEEVYTIGAICLLANPIVLFIEYYTFAIAGQSYFMEEILDRCVGNLQVLSNWYLWIPLSVAVTLLISFGFMKLAAYTINPLHAKKKESKKAPAQAPVTQTTTAQTPATQIPAEKEE